MNCLKVVVILAICVVMSRGAHQCLNCTGVSNTNDCRNFVTCHHYEDCKVVARKHDSHIVYDFGCHSSDHCESKERSDTILCEHCCHDGSTCNRHACDQTNFTDSTASQNTAHGPGMRCLTCRKVYVIKHCTTYNTCKYGEVCATQSQIVNGKRSYSLGCMHPMDCKNYAAKRFLVSRYDSGNKCLECCHSNSSCGLGLCQHWDTYEHTDEITTKEPKSTTTAITTHKPSTTTSPSSTTRLTSTTRPTASTRPTTSTRSTITTRPIDITIPTTEKPACEDYELSGLTCKDLDTVGFCHNPDSGSFIIARQFCRKYCGFCKSDGGETTKPILVPTKPALLIPTHPPAV